MNAPLAVTGQKTESFAVRSALPGEAVATLDNVSKTYHLGKTEVHALNNLNLRFPARSFTFVVGPSGCGKTTLLNLIGGIDHPTEGRISVLNQPLGGLSDNGLSDFRARNIGFIFQNFSLIDVLTAYENIEYPLMLSGTPKKERKAIVDEIVSAVGLWDRREHMPERLSGGQRQRVAIARALVKRPLLVIADEPTANLDSATSQEVIALMRAMQKKFETTFVFSSHDKEMMQHADYVISLRDGVVESAA